MSGFWSGVGRAASVDWCEPNYSVSPYVAEWWNTLSSVPIAALGFAGWWLARRAGVEPRFRWAFWSLGFIGLGSAAFHGTLLEYPQAADELPMVYTSLIFAYILRFRAAGAEPDAIERKQMRRWGWGLALYGAVFTVLYASLESYFQFFIATYALIVGYVCVRSLLIALGRREDRGLQRLLLWSVGCYLGGFFGFWIPEHVLLSCEHGFQALQPHALFHLTSAVGSYAWVLFALYDRQGLLGRGPEVGGRLPFVLSPRAPQASPRG